MIKKHEVYLKIDNEYTPSPGIEIISNLVPGFYKVDFDFRTKAVTFVKSKATHDELVDLPGTEYEAINRDVDTFLSDECIARFKEVGFLHKFNILLHGLPGTGKTCLVNRVAQKVIAKGGIVIFNPTPESLRYTYEALDSIQPNTRVLVIFEELDQHVKENEGELLHVLDGEVQKSNAMYIATTNYIHLVPTRIRRPGRFSAVIEVGFPNKEARTAYLRTKLKEESIIQRIVEKTNNFSIDELKEVVRGYYCMGKDLDTYIKYVAQNANKSTEDLDTSDLLDSERYSRSFHEEEIDFADDYKRINSSVRHAVSKINKRKLEPF